jgi:hypothetical protein
MQRDDINSFLKKTPGWCEISYINNMENNSMQIREYLLAWIFASIHNEHGFSLSVSQKGYSMFNDKIFLELIDRSRKELSKGYYKFIYKKLKRAIKLTIGK